MNKDKIKYYETKLIRYYYIILSTIFFVATIMSIIVFVLKIDEFVEQATYGEIFLALTMFMFFSFGVFIYLFSLEYTHPKTLEIEQRKECPKWLKFQEEIHKK